VICVTTRFVLRMPWDSARFWLRYRRMYRDLSVAPGLLRHAFFFQSPCVCCTFSLWATRAAMESFNSSSFHVDAVRFAKPHARAIWSAHWDHGQVSAWHNLWPSQGNGHTGSSVLTNVNRSTDTESDSAVGALSQLAVPEIAGRQPSLGGSTA